MRIELAAALCVGLVLTLTPSAIAQNALPADAVLRLSAADLPSVRGVAFSPDGKQIATRGEPADPSKPRRIRIWDATTGKLIRSLECHDVPLTAIAFSPDGRFIAGGQPEHGAGIQVWDARSGRRVSRIDGGRGRFHFLAGGGEIAVVSAFGSNDVVRVHNTATGREVRRFIVDQNYRFVFSADGTKMLSIRTSGRSLMRVYDVQSGKVIAKIDAGKNQPTVFALSRDGRTVAAATSVRIERDKYEHHVKVWEVATETIVHEFTLHAKRILAAAFSPDGRFLATAGLDRSVRLWELATGKPAHVFTGHRGPVAALEYSPDGSRLASGGFDRSVVVWNASARSKSSLPQGALTKADYDNLWEELASATPSKAYRAIGRVSEGKAPAMQALRKRVHGILVPSQNERIKELLVQLDDDDSRVRHRATRELRKLRKIALPILIKTIKETTSAEVRYRLRRILEGPEGEDRFSPSDIRRMLRILHAAERVGGEDAEAIVEMIAKNLANAPRVVKEATETLKRMRAARGG